MAGIILTSAIQTAYSVDTTGIGMPFPQVKEYGLKPTSGNWEDHRDAIIKYYNQYKDRYMKDLEGDAYYYSKETHGQNWTITVSEQHGYAMIITAMMAGQDEEAQTIFDSLVDFYLRFRRHNGLMNWLVWSGGAADQGSAFDGDADIAYALMLANAQWGTSGRHNYLDLALNASDGIWADEINSTTKLPLCGDQWGKADITRPSDWMAGHFRVYDLYDNGSDWTGVSNAIYSRYNSVANSNTGLVPDFLLYGYPANGYNYESEYDGEYYTNACRVPMRFAMDYARSGNNDAKNALRKMVSWIGGKTGNDAANIVNGYRLGGDEIGTSPSLIYLAPFGAACVATQNQDLMNSIWDYINNGWLYEESAQPDAFNEAIALMSMMVMTGNWWIPGDENTYIDGFQSSDGVIFDHFENDFGDDNYQTRLGVVNGAVWGDEKSPSKGGDSLYAHGGGWWYTFDDEVSTIKSKAGTVLTDANMNEMVSEDKMHVTFDLKAEGYAGISAEILANIIDGDEIKTESQSTDLHKMTGISITYKSSASIELNVETDDIHDKVGYGGYTFPLPKSETLSEKVIAVDRLSLPEHWVEENGSYVNKSDEVFAGLSWNATGARAVKALTFKAYSETAATVDLVIENITLVGLTYEDIGLRDRKPSPVSIVGTPVMSSGKITTVLDGNSLNVDFFAPSAGETTMSLFTLNGRQVASMNNPVAAGSNSMKINTSPLAAGIYLLHINTNGVAKAKQISIMK